MKTENSILSKLLSYDKIVIQCHNNPDSDALASGLAVYNFLKSKSKTAELIYSGYAKIAKANLKYMISECYIPIKFVVEQSEIGTPDVLVTVDCQYGQANVSKFNAKNIMIIDHHLQMVQDSDMYYIKSNYQSCSTIMYQLLLNEGYDIDGDEALKIALYYGLYIDTSSFQDIYNIDDINMMQSLNAKSPVLTKLLNSNMNAMELMVACDALYNNYMDIKNRFIIVSALRCDQSILGIIGDFVIQVDICLLSLTFSIADMNYQFSIRCCNDEWKASDIAKYISKDIGSGGGHAQKAGGRISKQGYEALYPNTKIDDYFNEKLCEYIHSVNAK